MATDSGNAQACYGDSGGPLMGIRGGEKTVFGVVSWGVESDTLICDWGGVQAIFGPATREFIDRSIACPMIPMDGLCGGDVAVRCATLAEGGFRPLTTDCSLFGLTCGQDSAGELACVVESGPSSGLSCEGNCGVFCGRRGMSVR